jgi:hypothetical protein
MVAQRSIAKNFKTPTLVIHSQLDYRLDVSEGFQLFTTLQRLNVPSKMLYFPDEGHWIHEAAKLQLWYKTVNDWVDQWRCLPHPDGRRTQYRRHSHTGQRFPPLPLAQNQAIQPADSSGVDPDDLWPR